MGTKAHIRTVSRIKYEEAPFSNEMEKLADILDKYSCDNNLYDDSNCLKDQWEIPVENLKKTINGLQNDYEPDDVVFNDWTCQQITDTFERWINLNKRNESNLDFPDVVQIDWF
jgi:hypothetical protein